MEKDNKQAKNEQTEAEKSAKLSDEQMEEVTGGLPAARAKAVLLKEAFNEDFAALRLR